MDKVGSILVHSGPYVRGAGGQVGLGGKGMGRRGLPAATPASHPGFRVADTAELLAHLAPVSAQGVPAGEQGDAVGEQGVTLSPGQVDSSAQRQGEWRGAAMGTDHSVTPSLVPFSLGAGTGETGTRLVPSPHLALCVLSKPHKLRAKESP